MSLLIIVFCAWFLSAVIRSAKETKRKRAEAQRSADLKRMTAEWRAQKAQAELETKRMIALEREQMRQAREQEKLAKEQERQAEVLRKHEKRLADLEERMAVAEGEIEFQSQQIERLREHIEHAETERDACVYGSSRYYQWDKKCLALEKQIHTAESKMAKAQYIKTSAAKELAA